MPLFEYFCESCKSQNEILIRGNETPRCPDCGSEKLTKQLSAFAPVSAAVGRDQMPACASGGACPGGSCPFSQ